MIFLLHSCEENAFKCFTYVKDCGNVKNYHYTLSMGPGYTGGVQGG